MSKLHRGIYYSIVTEALAGEIHTLEHSLRARYADLHHSDVADRIAMHLARVLERAIQNIDDEFRVSAGIALARQLISAIVEDTNADLLFEQPASSAQFLSAVLAI